MRKEGSKGGRRKWESRSEEHADKKERGEGSSGAERAGGGKGGRETEGEKWGGKARAKKERRKYSILSSTTDNGALQTS